MKKAASDRKLERQAEQLAELLRRAGEPETEVQRRVQRALESARNRTAKREAIDPYAGCQSVTATARDLRIKGKDLFAWLAREGWLYRATDGWRALDHSLEAGWAVLRGRGTVQWTQLTAEGAHEVARRLGIETAGSHHG
ncbi:phage antirepressor KilAC domain-containing protein [Paraburkholderia azotifigens]|uniref:phage antirepressor KilAC domain-containing protein n=1 Tax=Paraburkholderia azotifigens TaxID=2057004 RepID=UPI003CCC8A96